MTALLPAAGSRGDWRPPTFVMGLLAANILLGLGHVLSTAIPHDVTIVHNQLNLNVEANLPTWFASMQWAGAAVLMALWARAGSRGIPGRRRTARYSPAIGLALVSFDEVARIHEWMGGQLDVLLPGNSRIGTPFLQTGTWMFVVFPLAFAFAGAALWMLRGEIRASDRWVRLIALGSFLFVLGAGGVELATNVAYGDDELLHMLVLVEELLELMGASVVVWGAYEALRSVSLAAPALSPGAASA